jgi:hypothetical protein
MICVGIDLSLTQTAAVAVPSDWGLDWGQLRSMTCGAKLTKDATVRDCVKRVDAIADALVQFCGDVKADSLAIEGYAFGARQSQSHSLGELGGVVKSRLVACGYPIEVVTCNSARKMLGKAPRKDAKIWAARKLYAMGAPVIWSLDELDAFLICNYVLAGYGGDAILLEAA